MKTRIIKTLILAGYIALAICGVPQWWHMLTTRDVSGVSLPFLLLYFFGLACLQTAFTIGNFGRALYWGNLAGLGNAALCLGFYLGITGGGWLW